MPWRPRDGTSIRQEVRSLRQPFGTNTDQSNIRWDVRRCWCGSECEDSSQARRIAKGMGVRYWFHTMHIHMNMYNPPCRYCSLWWNMVTFIATSTQYNTIQYNTIQYNTIQYNTIQYNAIQYNTIQYNTIQCNTVLQTRIKSSKQNKLILNFIVYFSFFSTFHFLYFLFS